MHNLKKKTNKLKKNKGNYRDIWNIDTLSYKYNKSIMTLEIMTIVNIFLRHKYRNKN